MHPLAGMWTANRSKSRRGLNPRFHSATMRVEVSGDTMRITDSGVNTSGQHQEQTQMVVCNGEAHPVPGAPGLVAIGALGPRGLEWVAKRGRAVMSRSTYDVSDDGRTMTATVSGIDAHGRLFHQVLVFDRTERRPMKSNGSHWESGQRVLQPE
ncbi:MAG: hypothetical protein A3G76_05020 [Acidobacteria bacterium RIFCSPLOWO2_12_FULL_65_11]|nr:MAG: hypothetical protein A3H95_10560 [Acidobacteria bacterium RIFCSPLOWO2_02_FULL_64_15]OFW31755.1 MAG: hypothetical protein A3G76_05020 [Acidobacteria bacterium RIFCSPLOWO2_12_FULL_65_11]